MNELISVILPVYNGERYLRESIKSILSQTHKNIELIIINDGSTDNSNLIIESFLKDNRIKYIYRSNKGLVYSLNEAINICSGKYIARMDQDDICYPNRLEKQLNFMLENGVDVCGTSYDVINEFGTKTKTISSINNNFEILISAMMVPFIHPSVMFKNFFKDIGVFYGSDSKIEAEDYDLWIKLQNKGLIFGNVKDVLIKYRILNNSMSRINKINIFKEVYVSCNNFNKENKNKLLDIFNSIEKDSLTRQLKPIIVKSILNYFKVNRFSLNNLNLFFKIDIYSLVFGLLLFIKQEIKYLLYQNKVLYKLSD